MIISGKIKKKKALIVTPERLKALCNMLLKHCERLEFSAETYSKTSISFDNIDELFEYDNFKPRRIVSVEVAGYVGYSRITSIEIGDLNFSMLLNYGSTVRCDYKFASVDAETLFCSEFETWYQKSTASYWLLGKFSLSGLLFLPSAFITFIRFLSGEKTNIDSSNLLVLLVVAMVIILTLVLVYAVKLLDAHLLGNLFPAVAFLWGEEKQRNEKWAKYRSNFAWSIIIALLIGLVTNYLYDTLKGL